tara:strand:+ start:967 stop:1392 length:426 start_codon:yes stop_codon:yes gene_type:complete
MSDRAVDGIRFEDHPPPVADFIRMRADCGWGEDSPDVCGPALETSLAAITVFDAANRLIGFARAVGDPLYIYIQDVIIAPELRGKGLGGRLMQHFLAQLTRDYPHATIMLMSEKGRERFYVELGFEVRPSENFGPGMQLVR